MQLNFALAAFAVFATSASACLIASFEYIPAPPDTLYGKPHLRGNITSSNHPSYPEPMCRLSKAKLAAPNDMLQLWCEDAGTQAYVWLEGVPRDKEGGITKEEVFGTEQNVGFITGATGPLGTGSYDKKLDFSLQKDPGNENHVGAWNYECNEEHA